MSYNFGRESGEFTFKTTVLLHVVQMQHNNEHFESNGRRDFHSVLADFSAISILTTQLEHYVREAFLLKRFDLK